MAWYGKLLVSSHRQNMEYMLSLALTTLGSILWLILYWRPRRHLWAAAAKLPGPKGWPLIGNSLMFMGSMSDSFANMCGMFTDHGPVVRFWTGDRLFVMVYTARDAQRVLGNPRVRNRDKIISAAIGTFFGDGLLSNRDETWRVHRKFVTPAFHFKILETYVPIFAAKAAILVQQLDKMADGRPFNVYTTLGQCTLDAICETAIGMPMNTQPQGETEFMRVFYDVTQFIHRRSMQPWLLNPFVSWLLGEGKSSEPLVKVLESFSADVIHRKVLEHRAGLHHANQVLTGSDKKVASFLDMLIAEGGATLSEREIQDEVGTMAAAGLETTASTMSFVLLMLALHPDEQMKVQAELFQVFGVGPAVATPENLAQLTSLERVIKETLRLIPVVTILPRELPEDITLESGHVLPRGATAIVFPYILHRDPENFPEPELFKPDRWLPQSAARHPFAYLPFSGGARNCVGQKYAMLQMKTVLAAILHRYRVTTPFTMETMQQLELSITLCIDQSIKYQVALEIRDKLTN